MTTTTATKFNAGDKVRYVNENNKAWDGVEGVIETAPVYVGGNVTVRLTIAPTGWAGHFRIGNTARIGTEYLELVPEAKPFTFADIQKGDTIRRTQTFKSGATEVREGTVEKKASWYVSTDKDSYILAYDTDGKPEVTLELLNRPEPEPVKADWETAKAGDRLVVEGNDTTRILTKQADGLWGALLISSHSTGNGIQRDDAEIHHALKDPYFSKDGSYKFIPAVK